MSQSRSNAVRPPTPYETHMREQGVPIFRGFGLPSLNELPLGLWERTGGRGAFIQLDGMEGMTGMYAVEIPPGGALVPERHLYEEMFHVVRGRGTTEVWKEDGGRKQAFEWQTGSLFSPPINTWHRLVNAAASPALLLALTNAPLVMDLFHNSEFIFQNDFDFSDRYDGQADYFQAREPELHSGVNRYVRHSNIIPDVVSCDVPKLNPHAYGGGVVWLQLAENVLCGHIAEYRPGRYTKCHAHFAGAVLICLSGQGYSIAWPSEYGTRPWDAGLGQYVKRQDYEEGGLVSPGTGWFHQHFNTGRGPLRFLALRYGSVKWSTGFTLAQTRGGTDVDIKKGGRTIDYRDEDPQIRADFMKALDANGGKFDMPESIYE